MSQTAEIEWRGREGPFGLLVGPGVFSPTTTSRTLADALSCRCGMYIEHVNALIAFERNEADGRTVKRTDERQLLADNQQLLLVDAGSNLDSIPGSGHVDSRLNRVPRGDMNAAT